MQSTVLNPTTPAAPALGLASRSGGWWSRWSHPAHPPRGTRSRTTTTTTRTVRSRLCPRAWAGGLGRPRCDGPGCVRKARHCPGLGACGEVEGMARRQVKVEVVVSRGRRSSLMVGPKQTQRTRVSSRSCCCCCCSSEFSVTFDNFQGVSEAATRSRVASFL